MIAILIPPDYWTRPLVRAGNAGSHRALPDILAALREAGGQGQLVMGGKPDVTGFSGLILPGGGDIHPQHYGFPGAEGDFDSALDEFQLEWTRAAFAHDLPVLGICRGMQVMNVAAGGTLHQHVDDHMPDVPRSELVHPITIESPALAQVVETECLQVNSIHHQALDRLGTGLRAVAWAPDGIIEAVERAPHQRGVQFHPEDLRLHRPFQRLFAALVAGI